MENRHHLYHTIKRDSDDIVYLLVVMECLSRNKFVAPMKSKSTVDTLHHFKNIHFYIGPSPHSIYVDKGTEFNSVVFRNYCNDHEIKLTFSQSVNKDALVERSQCTLQGIMFNS